MNTQHPPSTKVLVIIPALNESDAIGRLVKEIKAQHPEYDVLVIDDGSTDNTAHIAAQSGARSIILPYNLGIGGAVQTGFKIAAKYNYDAAIQVDGDAQHDPQYLNKVLEPVLKGELDLCIGSRFLSNTQGFKSTFVRRLGIRFFSFLLYVITRAYVTDPTSGFRATSKKLIPYFAKDYPVDFPEPEAIQLAKRLGASVGEVPVKMRERVGGTSSIRHFKSGYYMTKVTLAILINTLKHIPKRL